MARWGGLFVRKSIEEAVAESERSALRRALGPLDLTGIGVAAIIGAGIFFFLGEEARTTGPAVVLSLLLGGLAAVLAALAYAEFASLIPGSGSAYVYAYAALGRLPAFMMGWLILNAYAVGNMTVAIAWSEFARSALAGLGSPVPAALSGHPFEGAILDLPAALIMAAVTLVTLPKIRESTFINNALVVLKLAIVLFIVVFGALLVRTANYEPFNAAGIGVEGWNAVMASAAVLFFAYLGFDTVAATAEESRRPRRDLPIGIIGSVGLSTVLYVLMALVVTGMTSASEMPDDAPPVPTGFSRLGYPWAAGLITAGALVGLATVLYAFHLALARILYSMARDGFLPSFLARLHPSTGTPWGITIATGVFSVAGAAFLPLEGVVDMTVLASIFVYVFVSGGVLVLKWKRPDAARRFSVPWPVPALSIALLLVIAFLGIRGAFVHTLFWMWTGAGLMVYGFYGHRRVVEARRSAAAPSG